MTSAAIDRRCHDSTLQAGLAGGDLAGIHCGEKSSLLRLLLWRCFCHLFSFHLQRRYSLHDEDADLFVGV